MDVYYLVSLPLPSPVFWNHGLRGNFHSVFESKGLIGKVFRNKNLQCFLGLVSVRSGVKRVKPHFSGRISLFRRILLFKDRRDSFGVAGGVSWERAHLLPDLQAISMVDDLGSEVC